MQIYQKENITCIEMGGPKLPQVFAFLVDGMLVDTGSSNYESKLIPFYEYASYDLVALTHSHEDHTGNAPWIQKNRNVPIYIHPKGIESCSKPAPTQNYRQNTWGIRQGFEALPIRETMESRNKEWDVIYTPGHTDDHISLFHEETGTLFSGDLFVNPRTKVIKRSESIPQIMDSFRTVLAYDIGPMFCSHAGYIRDGKIVLKQKLNHLENLYGDIKALHEKGLKNEEIDEKLFPKTYSITLASHGEFDSLHIISSVVSHIKESLSRL